MTPACRNCKWWATPYREFAKDPGGLRAQCFAQGDETMEMGECRRYAPHPYFRSTREDAWCGEFTAKE